MRLEYEKKLFEVQHSLKEKEFRIKEINFNNRQADEVVRKDVIKFQEDNQTLMALNKEL